jgi:hypothetical protein
MNIKHLPQTVLKNLGIAIKRNARNGEDAILHDK